MFRRRWSGLPEDPFFPADLKELGYFVDPETDEIRQISKPSYYYDYFISNNVRYNDRQRFAFTNAVQDQVLRPRLEALDLVKLSLPLGTPDDQPHVPIYVSRDLERKKRIVVIFGESEQELGVIAHRVIGGKGGVDEGSMVGVVKALQGQKGPEKADGDGDDHEKDNSGGLGVVLANTGELWWWPEGGRGLSPRLSQAVPGKSCVHWGRFYDAAANAVPGNECVDQHVRCVFESVLGNLDFVAGGGRQGVSVQVIGVTDGAVAAAKYLDRNWERWAGKIGCMAMLSAGPDVASLTCEGFKDFLKEKSRLYITCQEPVGTVISGPDGNPNTTIFTSYSCPIFSSGEIFYSELTLIKARDVVLPWLEEVHRTGVNYTNPKLEVTFTDGEIEETPPWGNDPDLAGPAAVGGGGQVGGGHQGHPDQGGLEIITREEWEARMEKEGKRGVLEPKCVSVENGNEDEEA